MKLRFNRIDLPLKHVFATSRHSMSVVRSILVELEQDELHGYGEVYEDLFYGVNVEDVSATLTKCKEHIDGYSFADPIAFFRKVEPFFAGETFAKAAVDCAAYDLWGKIKNRPIGKLLGIRKDRLPESSYTIGLDSIERMLERFNEAPNWTIYRIKMGEIGDMQNLAVLRQQTSAAFHLDMNGGWTLKKTIENLEELQKLGVQMIEDPLPPNDWEGMKKLQEAKKKKGITIPIFADESWKAEEDIEHCVKVFDGINVKILKCGGFIHARDMIRHVKELGLKVSSANTVESAVGVSAIAQLAPLLDFLGADGPHQIDKKIADGVNTENGTLVFPKDDSGCGIKVRKK